MNDTYLQDFGTRRSVHRHNPKPDPMASTGRWDDLYLRASKPRLRKKHRRDSMRRETKVYVAKGAKALHFQPNAEVCKLLGFTCDESKYKYKLDSPSYPSRHRELSLEDKPRQKLVRVVPSEWCDVYTSLRMMIHKIRCRDPRMTRLLVKDFQLLWPIRHQLAKSINQRIDRPVGFTEMQTKPLPPIPSVRCEPKQPSDTKELVLEYLRNKAELETLNRNEEAATRAESIRRAELILRQRTIYRRIGRWL